VGRVVVRVQSQQRLEMLNTSSFFDARTMPDLRDAPVVGFSRVADSTYAPPIPEMLGISSQSRFAKASAGWLIVIQTPTAISRATTGVPIVSGAFQKGGRR
jgi:hypothetical protein